MPKRHRSSENPSVPLVDSRTAHVTLDLLFEREDRGFVLLLRHMSLHPRRPDKVLRERLERIEPEFRIVRLRGVVKERVRQIIETALDRGLFHRPASIKPGIWSGITIPCAPGLSSSGRGTRGCGVPVIAA